MGESDPSDTNDVRESVQKLMAENREQRRLFREQSARFLALYESIMQVNEMIKRQASATMELRVRARDLTLRTARGPNMRIGPAMTTPAQNPKGNAL